MKTKGHHPKKSDRQVRIAVLMDRSAAIIEPMLPGVRRLSENDGRVVFTVLSDSSLRHEKVIGEFDGLIGDVSHEDPIVRWIIERQFPAVSIRGRGVAMPEYGMDQEAAVRMVVDHFLERQIGRFGFFALRGERRLVLRRAEAYREVLNRMGHESELFGIDLRAPGDTEGELPGFEELVNWIGDRQRGYGLLCANYLSGSLAISAAHAAGMRVPEDIAVAAIGGNETLCRFCNPPLSSVHFDSERMGREAAQRCLAMIRKQTPFEAGTTMIPPKALSVRGSSDVYAIEDTDIRRSLVFIRENLDRKVRLEDLAEHAMVSRSTIDRKFRELLHMTPGQMIRRTRLQRAVQLIRETRLPFVEVAVSCGFSGVSQLSRDLKKYTGKTPSQTRAGA